VDSQALLEHREPREAIPAVAGILILRQNIVIIYWQTSNEFLLYRFKTTMCWIRDKSEHRDDRGLALN